ncbi:tetratricopeptide repeat protein [bacterium SCSIO 12741]|nr:tetratricopeptide repeat protein [bacterium SCSIO 12741]
MVRKGGILVLLLGLFLVWSPALVGQTTDSQLAAHYYQNGEFDKAALYYKRLYDKDKNTLNYNYYLRCLVELKDYETAKKLIRGHQKVDVLSAKAKVDYGVILKLQNKTKQANKEYDKIIKNLPPNYEQVNQHAAAFSAAGEYDYALKAYQRGRVMLKNYYPFNIEVASVYGKLGQYDKMVDEYLDLLELHNGYLQTVQNAINNNIDLSSESEQGQILKARLVKKINQSPNNYLFPEMLIWLYQQEGNWKGALIQTKALDKRLERDGRRVYYLAEVLLNNQAYDEAAEACDYVLDYGMDGQFYIEARILGLETRYEKITRSGNYSSEDVDHLIDDYEEALFELGVNAATASLLREKGYIQAFYQHQLDSALNTFEAVLEIPGINEVFRASTKLDYGDALLAAGYIWDASIQYGQVDKAYKFDRLGEQAKFKGAKVHFYTGNFSLAKAQLDILKGATSKLIANDAMHLSILITDNSTVDTSTVPLKLYADADLLVVQNRFPQAELKLDSINKQFPGHALADEILMLRYDMAIQQRDYETAAGYLEEVMNRFSWDILADKATFLLAELNQNQFDKPERAKELYQKILTDFPDSLFVTEARKRFRALRGISSINLVSEV